jgi:hypothetical protein
MQRVCCHLSFCGGNGRDKQAFSLGLIGRESKLARREDDIRRIDNHGHSTLAVRHLGTIQPDRIGVIDLEGEHFARGREPAPDGISGHRLAGVGEAGSCNRMDGLCEGELDCVARDGIDCVRGKYETTLANGNLVDV